MQSIGTAHARHRDDSCKTLEGKSKRLRVGDLLGNGLKSEKFATAKEMTDFSLYFAHLFVSLQTKTEKGGNYE